MFLRALDLSGLSLRAVVGGFYKAGAGQIPSLRFHLDIAADILVYRVVLQAERLLCE